MAEKIRVTVDFSQEAYQVLSRLSLMLDCTKAEVLRKALGLLDYVVKEQRKGSKVCVHGKRGKTVELVSL